MIQRVPGRMRRAAAGALRRAGLQRASTATFAGLDDALARCARLGVAPRTVVDIGVAWGTPGLYDAFPAADLLLVDPLGDTIGLADQLREQGRNANFVEAAVGTEEGSTTLHVHPVATLSSLKGGRIGDDVATEAREVAMRTLDAIANEAAAVGPFVVKIDVEGGELDVLAGARQVLGHSELVAIECSAIPLVRDAPSVSDVVAAMREQGLVVYDIAGGHRRPKDGALAQIDVLFVPEISPLRTPGYADAGQARALYRSWGFDAGDLRAR